MHDGIGADVLELRRLHVFRARTRARNQKGPRSPPQLPTGLLWSAFTGCRRRRLAGRGARATSRAATPLARGDRLHAVAQPALPHHLIPPGPRAERQLVGVELVIVAAFDMHRRLAT